MRGGFWEPSVEGLAEGPKTAPTKTKYSPNPRFSREPPYEREGALALEDVGVHVSEIARRRWPSASVGAFLRDLLRCWYDFRGVQEEEIVCFADASSVTRFFLVCEGNPPAEANLHI